jgi:hypothetical protein
MFSARDALPGIPVGSQYDMYPAPGDVPACAVATLWRRRNGRGIEVTATSIVML